MAGMVAADHQAEQRRPVACALGHLCFVKVGLGVLWPVKVVQKAGPL